MFSNFLTRAGIMNQIHEIRRIQYLLTHMDKWWNNLKYSNFYTYSVLYYFCLYRYLQLVFLVDKPETFFVISYLKLFKLFPSQLTCKNCMNSFWFYQDYFDICVHFVVFFHSLAYLAEGYLYSQHKLGPSEDSLTNTRCDKLQVPR